MPDDHHRHAQSLCKLQKHIRGFPHLGHASGSGGDRLIEHGLDGIDDDRLRLLAADDLRDIAQIRLAQEQHVSGKGADPVSPHLDLREGFIP
jgi:hypothetical protein